MSTHLQVPPRLRSTSSTPLHAPAAGKENADSNKRSRTRPTEKLGGIGENCCLKSSEESSKSCRTPESDANKIPKTLACPPAPRKPIRRAVMSCKRKLMPEFEFFEADRRQEVDEFFKSSFDRILTAAAKRKIASPAAAAAVAVADSSSSSSSSPSVPCNQV